MKSAAVSSAAIPGGLFDGDWVESKDQDPDGDIRLLQLADVGDGFFRDRSDRWINHETYERLQCSYVYSGDVLVARMPDPIGRACIVPTGIGDAVTVVDVAVLRCNPEVADSRFVTYAINSQSTRSQVESMQDGATRQRISRKRLGRISIPFPVLPEQRAIADFLDRETARIDTLIEEQQRLIELLRERRQSMISDAVARGVHGSSSGWAVLPLRYTLGFQEGPGILAVDFRDEGVPLLRVSCVRGQYVNLDGCNHLDPAVVEKRWAQFAVEVGDLLISASASMGTVSEVTSETAGAIPYTGIIRITPGMMRREFIRWFMVSDSFMQQVESLKTGSTIQHFGPSHLAQMRVSLPSEEEQLQIAEHLDAQTAKIDQLIAEAERFIELSRERRAALITAAVTGQIDVRGEELAEVA